MTSIVLAGPLAHLRRSRVIRQLLQDRLLLVASALLAVLALVALAAPILAPHDPAAQDIVNRFQAPSATYWLGTDGVGRDIFSRLLFATRLSLLAALQGLGLAVAIGVPVGLLSGSLRGPVDAVLGRFNDALLAIPTLIAALAIVGAVGPGLTNAMLALGIVLSPRFYRIARGEAQSVVSEEYIEAARADGCSTWRLLWRHILPNASGPLLVQVSFGVGLVMIAEASLSFLGLGVQIPQASWGSMIKAAFDSISTSIWPLIPPAVVMTVTILALFLIGDGLRDALGRGSSGGS